MIINHKRKGFTVIEMVIVIVIIGVLATVLNPTFSAAFDTADEGKIKEEAKVTYGNFVITADAESAKKPAVYVSDGKYVAFKDAKVVGIFTTEQEAIDAVFKNGEFIDTGVEGLYIVDDPTLPFKKAAKAAYQTFLTKKGYKPSTPKPMLFKMNGKFVTMLNGAVQGIYDTQADAISAVYSGSAPLPTNVENLFILEDNFYRWEWNGSTATSVGSISSSLTLQSGSVTSDGVYARKSICKFEKPMHLYHNKPWVIEWVGKGTTFILTQNTPTHKQYFPYIYHRGNGIISMAYSSTGNPIYRGCAVGTTYPGVMQKYRLENRINSDGTNVLYCVVNDEHEYEMNSVLNLSNNSVSGSADGWPSTQDLVINYIGGTNTYLENYQFESLTVIENRD